MATVMMVAPKNDAVEVLCAVMPGVPASPDGPDFAAMLASVPQVRLADGTAPTGAVDSGLPPLPMLAEAVEDTPTPKDLAEAEIDVTCAPTIPVNWLESAKGHTIATPKTRAFSRGAGVGKERPTETSQNPEVSQNGTTCTPNVVPLIVVEIMPIKVVADDPEIAIAAVAPQVDPVRLAAMARKAEPVPGIPVEPKTIPVTPSAIMMLAMPGAEAKRKADLPVPIVAAGAEQQVPFQLLPMIEKVAVAVAARTPVFAVQIADVARDVLRITGDAEMRFNVKPDTLGPIAVTIERGEAGLGLKLGVETPAAVQAVRQAEPILNDVRGNAPFVQVSVDLNSPDARGRPARAAALIRRARQDDREIMLQHAPVTTGRYA
jgi:hypothetical protein